MITPGRLAELLNAELTRKSCSFAEYITTSAPYVPPGTEDLLALVKRMARRDREQAAALENAIVDLGGIPQPGIYDEGVADTNYLNIVYLCELLVRSRRSCLDQFGRRLEDCAGQPAVRELLLRVMEEDRSLLRDLEEAVERHNPKPAVPQPASGDSAGDTATAAGPAEGQPKPGFDLKSFLARRGPSKARPAAKPAAPSPSPSSPPAETQPPAEKPAVDSQDKKPFDMKAYLAARKARKDSESGPPAASD